MLSNGSFVRWDDRGAMFTVTVLEREIACLATHDVLDAVAQRTPGVKAADVMHTPARQWVEEACGRRYEKDGVEPIVPTVSDL